MDGDSSGLGTVTAALSKRGGQGDCKGFDDLHIFVGGPFWAGLKGHYWEEINPAGSPDHDPRSLENRERSTCTVVFLF